MIYLLVDTCVLSDIMRQYNPLSQYSELSEKVYLDDSAVSVPSVAV